MRRETMEGQAFRPQVFQAKVFLTGDIAVDFNQAARRIVEKVESLLVV